MLERATVQSRNNCLLNCPSSHAVMSWQGRGAAAAAAALACLASSWRPAGGHSALYAAPQTGLAPIAPLADPRVHSCLEGIEWQC